MYPGLDLYYADPAQPLTTAAEELHDLDRHPSVRGVLTLFRQAAAALLCPRSGMIIIYIQVMLLLHYC